MRDVRTSYVHAARIQLNEAVDPASVGAAVTVELCGHWEHEGPCRWPHNSAIDAEASPARFRTVAVAEDGETEAIASRIRRVLTDGEDWRVVALGVRDVAAAEERLATNLLSTPRRDEG